MEYDAYFLKVYKRNLLCVCHFKVNQEYQFLGRERHTHNDEASILRFTLQVTVMARTKLRLKPDVRNRVKIVSVGVGTQFLEPPGVSARFCFSRKLESKSATWDETQVFQEELQAY